MDAFPTQRGDVTETYMRSRNLAWRLW